MSASRSKSNRVAYGVMLVLCAGGLVVSAAADMTLSWWTVDSGGVLWTTGGNVELSGTIGQPDAGVLTGGTLTLSGGFWPGAVSDTTPPVCVGDLDCSGQVDFQDINPFVLYLSNYSAWLATYSCSPANGDINGDGTYGGGSFGDINPFVTLLTMHSLPISCP